MNLLILCLPFLVILGGMIGLHWSAFRAGLFAFVVSIFLVPLALPEQLNYSTPQLMQSILPGSLMEAVGTSFSILWIIYAALCIYYLQMSSGAITTIQRALSNLHPNPKVSALFVAWFFSLFMEGAAGFGTSAALTAPFLVAAGYRPVIAVVLALWGHSLGVTFGAVGTPVLSQALLVGLSELELSRAVLPFLTPTTLILAMGLSWGIHHFAPTQHHSQATGHIAILGLLAALCFLFPALGLAFIAGPELPTLLGALLGAGLFLFVIRKLLPPPPRAQASNPHTDTAHPRFIKAMSPYFILIALVLITRLVPEIKSALQTTQWLWEWRDYRVAFPYLYHPGTLLLVSFIAGAWLQGQQHAMLSAARQALQRIITVLPALLIMLLLSRFLVHSQAIASLGLHITALAGQSWPFWAPWFGVLGTFITGSATASNILFSEFQQSAAESRGYDSLALLGAQTTGAAIGNMVCPHNIIAAGATVNIQGKEGEVMRFTLPMAMLLSVIAGVCALLII